MADKIKVAVMGASGRMGQALMKGVLAADDMTLVGATERVGHDWIGRDVGACFDGENLDVKVQDNALESFVLADVVLDFTSPESSVLHAELAAQAKCVLVIGTTGFTKSQGDKIDTAGRHARIIRSGNMSVGVNLLVALTHQVAATLGDGFDIEIIETHHRHKVDAPSGTAIMLGKAAAEGRGSMLSNLFDRTRKVDGINQPRARGAIGFHSVRGGDIVGEHDVIFAADGERVVLRHIATDRNIFVRGALLAAHLGLKQPAGVYSMQDILESMWVK